MRAPSAGFVSTFLAMADDKLTRVAIINADKCKPKKCKQECKRSCPVVRMGTTIKFLSIFYRFLSFLFVINLIKLFLFVVLIMVQVNYVSRLPRHQRLHGFPSLFVLVAASA
jgi:hypothetical protein